MKSTLITPLTLLQFITIKIDNGAASFICTDLDVAVSVTLMEGLAGFFLLTSQFSGPRFSGLLFSLLLCFGGLGFFGTGSASASAPAGTGGSFRTLRGAVAVEC